MQYSQKYCLAAFLKPAEHNMEFDMPDWPLHITLADVFAIDRSGPNIDTKLQELIAKQPAITVTAKEQTTLGKTPVVLLEKSDELAELHNRLVDLLESNGARFNSPEFIREGFLPHCTIQKSGRLDKGASVRINEISLVDMFPHKNWQRRKVLSTFKLQEE